MDWRSNAAVDNLKTWVGMGVSYPDIAQRLGTTTGAVCGKVHRLGIGKGPRTPDRLYLKANKPNKPQLTPDAAFFAIMERQEEEAAGRLGLTITLDVCDEHHCRYVIGDPTKRQLCGARRKAGTPYCEEHAALCLGRTENVVSPEDRVRRRCTALRHLSRWPTPNPVASDTFGRMAVDPRTFEEADDPEPVASAA